jgi:mono/diheme cytochrome c family protein
MDSNDITVQTSKKTNASLSGSIRSMHLVAAATTCAAVVTIAFAATAQTPASSSETKVKTNTEVTSVKAEPLSGAQLWAMNCSRCHTARNPGEFTAAQWGTIILEMRVRANLPAAQARELEKYLKASAGK